MADLSTCHIPGCKHPWGKSILAVSRFFTGFSLTNTPARSFKFFILCLLKFKIQQYATERKMIIVQARYETCKFGKKKDRGLWEVIG